VAETPVGLESLEHGALLDGRGRSRRVPRPLARLIAIGAPEVPLGIDLPIHAAARERHTRSSRARRALPSLDLIWATAIAALFLHEWYAVLAYALLALALIGAIDGYHAAPLGGSGTLRSTVRLMLAAIVCGWSVSVVAGATGGTLGSVAALELWAATMLGWVASRRLVKRSERRRPERIVVVGSGGIAGRVFDLVERDADARCLPIGFVDDDPRATVDLRRHLGPLSQLETLILARAVDRVVVAFSQTPDAKTVEVLRRCDGLGVRVDVVPRLFDLLGPRTRSYALGGVPIMSVAGRGGRRVQRAGKRTLDLVGASLLLVLASPLLALVAVAIRLEGKGPTFFAQERVGRRGRRFRILKFRSMVVDADGDDATIRAAVDDGGMTIADAVAEIKADDDPRITRVGRLIRRTSLDELPQLWNVVRGEMSLVGPRPLRPFEAEALDGWQLARQLPRPGITGLWQVSGRSRVNWDERIQLDYSYVRHWSLADDLEILARTVPAVVAGDGAK
jgi:exopolysaccharide biosynthesis polyprenyl glycosylphosphotransferase